jgi:hypothetical protein
MDIYGEPPSSLVPNTDSLRRPRPLGALAAVPRCRQGLRRRAAASAAKCRRHVSWASLQGLGCNFHFLLCPF